MRADLTRELVLRKEEVPRSAVVPLLDGDLLIRTSRGFRFEGALYFDGRVGARIFAQVCVARVPMWKPS